MLFGFVVGQFNFNRKQHIYLHADIVATILFGLQTACEVIREEKKILRFNANNDVFDVYAMVLVIQMC